MEHILRYEDEQLYYAWKPHGIPSTWGDQYSFLSHLQDSKPPFFAILEKEFWAEKEYWLVNRLDNDTAWLLYFAKNDTAYQHYRALQSQHQLYKIYMCDVQGRVDIERSVQKYETIAHDTAVYQIENKDNQHQGDSGNTLQYENNNHKNLEDKDIKWNTFIPLLSLWQFSFAKQNNAIQKDWWYHFSILSHITQWNIWIWMSAGDQDFFTRLQNISELQQSQEQFFPAIKVAYPIMHNAYDKTRMIAVAHKKDLHKWREKMHMVSTFFIPIAYDENNNTTLCYAILHQWIRHQIRIHAAKLWYPLVGDVLYNPKSVKNEILHLWSIWLSASCNFVDDV